MNLSYNKKFGAAIKKAIESTELRACIFLFTTSLFCLISTTGKGQTLNGQTEICPGVSYRYSISSLLCDATGSFTCTGCTINSSTSRSVMLTWTEGAPSYTVSVPVHCTEPDSSTEYDDILSTTATIKVLDVPGFACPGDNPAGSLTGPDQILFSGSNATGILNYVKRSSYGGAIIKVEFYADGILFNKITGCNLSDNVTFRSTESGPVTITTRILDQCGNSWDGPNKLINVLPSCYQDNPANYNASLIGVGASLIEPFVYQVTKNQSYSINISGVTDFNDNYTIDFSDIGADGTYGGTTFSISKGLGSYRINFVKKSGRSSCNDIPQLKIFLGAKDETLEKTNGCPVVLPDDFPEFGFDPIVVTDPFVLSHFAGKVISKYAITVKPGLTLRLGAELVLEQGPPVTPIPDTDLVLNFIQTNTYNEYNQVLGQSRNYFDAQGRGLQSQYKNLTAGVMLATQTIYDAQGRAVINTLPAPISASTLTTAQNECGISQQVGEDISFGYKADFVGAYDFTKFDLYTASDGSVIDKENNPNPIEKVSPGTLGWYYSTNNGNASGNMEKINEPLVAATAYPYTRTIFQRDGSGEALGTALPGDQLQAGSDHVTTSINAAVSEGDPYLDEYLHIREIELYLTKSVIAGNFFKTTATDPNGKKSVAYTDKNGKTIISLYFGTLTSPITTSYQFYDDAGRLKASVSPNGVQQYRGGATFADIDKAVYEYNYKGFLLAANETDAGRTEYIYRKDGSIRFSQNAEQRKTGKYSYTHYDRSGRPIESGEHSPGTIAFNSGAMSAILENIDPDGGLTDGTSTDRIFTFYDLPSEDVALTNTGRIQHFVHGSVSYSRKNDEITSYYSYDEQGRVEWMVQDVKDLGVKTIDYRYGPTGAVREVAYQRGVIGEEFHHYYEYDADGRLSKVFTTPIELVYNRDGTLANAGVLELQSTYSYYLHGPLKRMIYANNIQGIDYVYTASGALKGINGHDVANDPGGDGNDLFGMTIDYYSGDYLSAGYDPGGITYRGNAEDQFGGLIKGTRWQGPVEMGQTFAYGYEYDQRYQLKDAQFNGGVYDAITNPYRESIGGYDANGNISTLMRKNGVGSTIADFTYNYATNKNQLTSVTTGGTPKRTYQYNDLGQMTQQINESSEELNVEYDVTGKVTRVQDENGITTADYVYDDRGFRLNKTSYDDTGVAQIRTWYVRDASGKVVSTYNEDLEAATDPIPVEIPVYGNGRLGLYKPEFGITLYELTDHLGNVRAVIGDKLTVEYLATNESERINQADRPEDNFTGISPVATAPYINHTPSSVTANNQTDPIADPNEVIRINYGMTHQPIGGGLMEWVHPGDKVEAEVYVKYANFDGSSNAGVGSPLLGQHQFRQFH